jgi:hypothetical protein
MSDAISDAIIRHATRNVTGLAATVAALLVLGAVLGAVKRHALPLLAGASRRDGGHGAKPRAALLLLAFAATGAAAYAVTFLLPRIKGLSLTSAVDADPALAEQREAELSERLAAELEQLQDRIDTLHAEGVSREAATINAPAMRRVFVGRTDDFLRQSIYRQVPTKRADYRKFQSHVHKEIRDGPVPSLASVTVIYHRRCAPCSQNLRIRQRIDSIREHQVRRARARQSKPQELPTDTPKGQLL